MPSTSSASSACVSSGVLPADTTQKSETRPTQGGALSTVKPLTRNEAFAVAKERALEVLKGDLEKAKKTFMQVMYENPATREYVKESAVISMITRRTTKETFTELLNKFFAY